MNLNQKKISRTKRIKKGKEGRDVVKEIQCSVDCLYIYSYKFTDLDIKQICDFL